MVCYIYWLFTLSISMLLGFCLSFCQFQLDVANKSFAYKKTCSPETVHSNNLMKKKYGTLQLPFICLFLLLTTFSGLQNCKSVFLILKIFHYGGSKRWFSFFQDIHIRMDIRLIDILTSIRPMTTTVWKVSVIGVFLVCISSARTEYREVHRISRYLVRMWENTDQKNSKYRDFSRRAPNLESN